MGWIQRQKEEYVYGGVQNHQYEGLLCCSFFTTLVAVIFSSSFFFCYFKIVEGNVQNDYPWRRCRIGAS